VFLNGGLPAIDASVLYSFVHVPIFAVETMFLGHIDMLGKSMVLAVLAGVTQHIHARYSFPKPEETGKERTFQEDFARSMRLQVLFILPIVVVFVGYITTAAVALYWVTSNLCSLVQEWYVKRTLERDTETE
jgi:membrane protein insertase Oxa1/YidC/SpoIIIJ